jgi:hypothetical protein
MCRFWQEDVHTTGATSFDQRQPGCSLIRPMAISSSWMISTHPLGNVRTSSGISKFLHCRRGMRIGPPYVYQTTDVVRELVNHAHAVTTTPINVVTVTARKSRRIVDGEQMPTATFQRS